MTMFLDSSILIEHSKGVRQTLIPELLRLQIPLRYNAIVQTEYIYYFLSMHGMKAPRTLKEAKIIPEILMNHDPLSLLNLFEQITEPHPPADAVV